MARKSPLVRLPEGTYINPIEVKCLTTEKGLCCVWTTEGYIVARIAAPANEVHDLLFPDVPEPATPTAERKMRDLLNNIIGVYCDSDDRIHKDSLRPYIDDAAKLLFHTNPLNGTSEAAE